MITEEMKAKLLADLIALKDKISKHNMVDTRLFAAFLQENEDNLFSILQPEPQRFFGGGKLGGSGIQCLKCGATASAIFPEVPKLKCGCSIKREANMGDAVTREDTVAASMAWSPSPTTSQRALHPSQFSSDDLEKIAKAEVPKGACEADMLVKAIKIVEEIKALQFKGSRLISNKTFRAINAVIQVAQEADLSKRLWYFECAISEQLRTRIAEIEGELELQDEANNILTRKVAELEKLERKALHVTELSEQTLSDIQNASVKPCEVLNDMINKITPENMHQEVKLVQGMFAPNRDCDICGKKAMYGLCGCYGSVK